MKNEMSPLRRAKALMGSIPIFAQQLCEKSLCKVVFDHGMDTACTDGETIKLPALPLPSSDADIETAEELADLVMCFIPHEVGHIRYSAFEPMRDAKSEIERSLLNAIEDPRMELDMIGTFPGTRGQIDRGLERMAGMGYYPVLTTEMDSDELLSLYCLYYLRGHLRESEAFVERTENSRSAVVDRFGDRFVERIEILLECDGMKMKSTHDAHALTKSILKAVEEAKDEAKKSETDKKPGDDDSAEQSSGGEQSNPQDDSGSDPSTGCSSSVDDGGEDDGKGGGEEKSTPDTKPTSAADGGGGASQGNGSTPFDDVLNSDRISCADLGESMSKAVSDVLGEADKTMARRITGTFQDAGNDDLNPTSTGFNADQATKASRQLKTRLRAMLQTKTLSRSTESVRGSRINTRRAYRSNQYNRRLFIHQDENKGVETAVFLLCDRSGSMDASIAKAAQAVYAIGDSMHSLTGVKVGAGLFPAHRLLFPIGMSPSSHIDRMQFSALGSTPLGQGVSWAVGQLRKRREPRKILMLVTDGEPDDPTYAEAMIAAAERIGIEVFAVGINTLVDKTLFSRNCVISNVDELPPAVLGMLGDALLQPQTRHVA